MTISQYRSMKATVLSTGGVQGPQKIGNGNFETDVNGWAGNTAFGAYGGTRTITRNSGGQSGYCMYAGWNAGTGKHCAVCTDPALAVTQGAAYQFSGYYFINSGEPSVKPIYYFGPSGNDLTIKGAWTYFSWTFVAGTDTLFLGFETLTNPPASPDTGAFFDTLSLKLTAAPYTILTDGSVQSCPAAALNGQSYAINQRVTVDVRNPLPPLIQGEETAVA